MADDGRPIPRATYRLQLNATFGFADAAALAHYLAKLGVSHVYCSPYLKARPGSTHGYDIVDHNALNPELGSETDFAAMTVAFRRNGLGQILDFVPNHMGVGGADNPLWLDVLEWGPDSAFAGWFDIDWDPERGYLQDKVLVPFLGDQYGAVLEAGHLLLKFDAEEGSFAVWAYDTHKLPVCPLQYADILDNAHPALERLGDAFAHLPTLRIHAGRRAGELKAELAALAGSDAGVAAAIAHAADALNGRPGDLDSFGRLDALIQSQHWRPAHFRVAADDINYRRFFNINDLAGIRMEVPEVFERAHRFVFRLLEENVLDGLRLDHVDGLLDPKAYCLRLREKAPRPLYLVVEKILAPHESLREDWGVDGTTGYEFANLLTGLLVDPAGETGLSAAYEAFAGRGGDFSEIVRACKLRIMDDEMASELIVLARAAGRVARSHPRTADFTNNVLQRALKQIIACFPVYRTYVDQDGASDADRRDIDWAIATARRCDAALDPSVFDFLHELLTADLVAEPRSGFSRVAVMTAAMRVQQYSGPVMAKGLEDTAFYRYNRLLALNEVGGSPERFGVSVATLHGANRDRARRTPHALLSTSTHDTKRGEDARARLAVLSELPEDWAEQVTLWSRMIRAPQASITEEMPPDRNDEYAFYQLLLAAWPAAFFSGGLDPDAVATFRLRIEAAMVKTLREAKLRTTWAAPDEVYEQATLDFVRHALDTARANPFLESFQIFAARIAPLGMRNSLVQTVLKLTVPGVPDIYQGAELWDLSLVDPDNRRPVDFDGRRDALEGVQSRTFEISRLLEDWQDGRIKLRLVAELLRLRGEHPSLFDTGSYEPLDVTGPDAERVCAFVREGDGARIIVAALLFPARGDAAAAIVALPEALAGQRWTSLFDERAVEVAEGELDTADLFAKLPVCVLMAETPAAA